MRREKRRRSEKIENNKKYKKKYDDETYLNENNNQRGPEYIENKHENVLLFCISILPQKRVENSYSYGERGDADYFECRGILSVEPGSKYIINKLHEKKEKLDRIIVVASKDAREKKDGEWGERSAVDVYKEQIEAFLNDFYSDEDGYMPVIEEVKFETGETIGELLSVINTVTAGAEDDKQIQLYIDTQGGYRNWAYQLDTLVGILKTYKNIDVAGRYAVSYSYNQDSPNKIIEVDEFFAMNDLLRAYQNYKRYGVCDDLFDYFSESSNKDVKKLAEAMKNAMDALVLCNMNELDKKLNEVADMSEKLKYHASESKFHLIIDDIQEDFKKINPDKYADKIISRVRWCRDKGMIMQALNIIESEFPQLILDLPLVELNYEPDGIVTAKCNGEIIPNIKKTNKDVVEKEKGLYDPKEILSRQLIYQRISGMEEELKGKNVKSMEKSFEQVVINNKLEKGTIYIQFRQKETDKIVYYYPASYTVVDKYVNSLNKLSCLYMMLKKERNNADHLTDEIKPMAYIKECIDKFLEILDLCIKGLNESKKKSNNES
ncbi:MAG: hypothetical protein E7271_10015 [Lachnospiraceae bacterium]|nr:hypothetical protein [Lachnospiraceae bacterium]